VSTSATAAQSLVSAGNYSVKAIPNIVIGTSTYSFTSTTVAATYGTTSAILVGVTRTNAGAAITGGMTTNASSGTTAVWSNPTILTTRSVTFGSSIGLTGPGASVAYTCASSDVAITVTYSTTSGVNTCVLTGATVVTADTPVIITFTATGGGTGLTANAISSTITIDRTVAGAAVWGTITATGTTSDWVNQTLTTSTRTFTFTAPTGINASASVTYSCSSSNAAIAVAYTLAAGIHTCTLSNTVSSAAAVIASTPVTITFSAAGAAAAPLTAATVTATAVINRIP